MLYSLNRTMCFVFFFFPFFWPLCFLSIDFSLSISVFLERKTYILCHHRVIAFQTLQNISETYQKPFWELIFRTLCHILAACVWCECACIRGLRLIWISYTINDIWYGWTYQYILKQSLTLRYQWHFIDGVCVRALLCIHRASSRTARIDFYLLLMFHHTQTIHLLSVWCFLLSSFFLHSRHPCCAVLYVCFPINLCLIFLTICYFFLFRRKNVLSYIQESNTKCVYR